MTRDHTAQSRPQRAPGRGPAITWRQAIHPAGKPDREIISDRVPRRHDCAIQFRHQVSRQRSDRLALPHIRIGPIGIMSHRCQAEQASLLSTGHRS
jgi:hypothetical protein